MPHAQVPTLFSLTRNAREERFVLMAEAAPAALMAHRRMTPSELVEMFLEGGAAP